MHSKSDKKERVMALKSQVAQLTSELQHQVEELPERLEDAQRAVTRLGGRARTFVRKNPGASIFGAVALGFLIAKVARHA